MACMADAVGPGRANAACVLACYMVLVQKWPPHLALAPLAQNTQLEILDFQSNPISSLEGLENLSKLENVWASNCQVADFREIERALRDKESLEEVYFEGNPVQKREPVLYRNKLRLALPQVAKIDACELYPCPPLPRLEKVVVTNDLDFAKAYVKVT